MSLGSIRETISKPGWLHPKYAWWSSSKQVCYKIQISISKNILTNFSCILLNCHSIPETTWSGTLSC